MIDLKWLDCIKVISTTDKAGKCPYCNGSNTDYTYVLVSDGKGYFNIWCNDCKKMGHISRVKIDNNIKKVIDVKDADKVIPKYKITY